MNNIPSQQSSPPQNNRNVGNVNQRDIIDTLYDLMHDYNENIRGYNQNVNLIINTLQSVTPIRPVLQPNNIFRNSYRNQNALLTTILPNDNFRYTYNDTYRRNTPTNRNDEAYTFVFDIPIDMENINSRNNDGMTEEEINTNITTIDYTDDLIGQTCPISLEEFNESDELCKINTCGHIFKKNYLINWFQRHRSCPLCRSVNDISDNDGGRLGIDNANNNISTYITQLFSNLLDNSNVNLPPIRIPTTTLPIYTNRSRGNTRNPNINIFDTSNNIH